MSKIERIYGIEVVNVVAVYGYEPEQAKNFVQFEKKYGEKVAGYMVVYNFNFEEARNAIKAEELKFEYEKKRWIREQAINFVDNLPENHLQSKYDEYITQCKNAIKYENYYDADIEGKRAVLIELLTDVKFENSYNQVYAKTEYSFLCK